jgi:hypothetical protein
MIRFCSATLPRIFTACSNEMRDVGADQVQLVPAARNIGVYMHVDGELSLKSHISPVAASCFKALR